MRAHNLRLFLGSNGPGGAQLHSLDLAGGKVSAEAEWHELVGVAPTFSLVDLQPVPAAIRLALGGQLDGAPVVYTARLDGETKPGAFTIPIPSPQPERLTALGANGEYLVAFTQRALDGRSVDTGWLINIGAPEDQQKWVELPFPSERRIGHASLVTERLLILAGGIREDGAAAVGLVDLMPFDGLNVTPWKRAFPAVPGKVREVLGTSSSQGAFLIPQVKESDSATSGTVYTSFHAGESGLSTWQAIPTDRAAAPVVATTFDPANSQLLVMTGEPTAGTVRLTAYKISALATAKRPTMADAQRDRMEQLAPKIAAVNIDEAILKAREKGTFVFAMITDGTKDQDLLVRTEISKSGFRYMLGTSEVTLFSGSAGDEVAKRFGVAGTPAYLLINGKGALEGSHSGSIPSTTELLKLTGPIRAPRDPQ
jgi:hypothetical protein